MQVLLVVIGLPVVLFGLLIALASTVTVAAVVVAFLPTLMGLVGCVALWRSGHDNLGVLVFLCSIVLLRVWPPFVKFAEMVGKWDEI